MPKVASRPAAAPKPAPKAAPKASSKSKAQAAPKPAVKQPAKATPAASARKNTPPVVPNKGQPPAKPSSSGLTDISPLGIGQNPSAGGQAPLKPAATPAGPSAASSAAASSSTAAPAAQLPAGFNPTPAEQAEFKAHPEYYKALSDSINKTRTNPAEGMKELELLSGSKENAQKIADTHINNPAKASAPSPEGSSSSPSSPNGVVSMGRSMVGMNENKDKGKLQEFMGGFDPAANPWCAQFASKLYEKNGGSPWGTKAHTGAIRDWAKQNGKFIAPNEAAGKLKPGDAYIKGANGDQHTGIVTDVIRDGSGRVTAIKTLDGNTSNQVTEKTRPISDAYGFVSV